MTAVCPICNGRSSVEAILQTEAGQAYMRRLLNLPDYVRFPLGRYVLMFAAAGREMAYDRRLRLVEETLALATDHRRLGVALAETVEALMQKREAGDVRPLKNHNYLKRVLESVTIAGAVPVTSSGSVNEIPAKGGKRKQALEVLAEWAGDDWLRREIAEGLMALVALSLRDTPGADTVTLTASVWETAIRSAGVTVEQIDKGRVHAAFKGVLTARLERWPEPAAVIGHLPRRPAQRKLEAPSLSDEERAEGAAMLREAREKLEGRR